MESSTVQSVLKWIRETLPGRGRPVPKEAFSGYVAVCPQTVVELVIVDKIVAPFNGSVLLHYRSDPWCAWHTIGGFAHAGEPMHAACNRHAADMGLEIKIATHIGMQGMIGWREDMSHPYGWNDNGHLVHHYFLCEATKPIVETLELRWFTKDKLPLPLLRGHEAHTDAYYSLK